MERDGQLVQVDPYEVAVGDEIVVKAGERVPLDGVVLSGTSQLDTAASPASRCRAKCARATRSSRAAST